MNFTKAPLSDALTLAGVISREYKLQLLLRIYVNLILADCCVVCGLSV